MARNFKFDSEKVKKERDNEVNNRICPICHSCVLKEHYEQRPKILKCHLCGYAREIKDKPKRD